MPLMLLTEIKIQQEISIEIKAILWFNQFWLFNQHQHCTLRVFFVHYGLTFHITVVLNLIRKTCSR